MEALNARLLVLSFGGCHRETLGDLHRGVAAVLWEHGDGGVSRSQEETSGGGHCQSTKGLAWESVPSA